MKKQLLKLTMLAFVVLFSASTIQAQDYEEYSVPGYYTIGPADGSGLLLTIDGSDLSLIWGAPITGGSQTQEWAIQDHVTPAGNGFIQIVASIDGVGNFTLAAADGTVATDGTNVTIQARVGDPVEVTSGDHSGLDQFQRRKTSSSRGSNDALFFKSDWSGGSRYGVVPSAAGDPVKFDGGGIDKLEFKLQSRALPLSVNTFGVDKFSISNPVSNQLTIKGATEKVNKVTVYSVLGNTVLSKAINNQNGDINVSVGGLSSGLYIVELNGENGERLTKKIIKQ